MLLLISTQATLLSLSGFQISATICDTGEFITKLLDWATRLFFFSTQTTNLCHMMDVQTLLRVAVWSTESTVQECCNSDAASNTSHGPFSYTYCVKVDIIPTLQSIFIFYGMELFCRYKCILYFCKHEWKLEKSCLHFVHRKAQGSRENRWLFFNIYKSDISLLHAISYATSSFCLQKGK